MSCRAGSRETGSRPARPGLSVVLGTNSDTNKLEIKVV